MPHEVRFTPVEESDDATFLWEFGDGATSTERSPTHIYQDAREFVARLTVSKGDSDIATESTITLEPGEAGWIAVEPTTLTLESGERRQIAASAFDTLGNPVNDVSFEWTASDDAGFVLDDGTFVAGPEIGQFRDAVTVKYERLGVVAEATVPVEIVLGELDSLVLDPPSINLRVNSRIDVNVVARDRQGHVLPEPDIDWQPLRGGVDTVLAGGEFRAGELPTQSEQELLRVAVTVGDETLSETISGSIAPGILDRLDIAQTPEQTTVDSPMTFSATAFDRFGNELELDSLEWSLVDDQFGEISAEGVFTPSGDAVAATGPLVIATGELDRVRSIAEIAPEILPGIAVEIVLNPLNDSIPVGAGNPFVALVVDEFGNVIEDVEVIWTASAGGTVTDQGIFIAGFATGEFVDAVTATLAAGASGNLAEISASADVVIRDRSSNMLAVEVSNDTDAGILLIDLETAALLTLSEELDNDAGIEVSPAWWPDGRRLAYSSDATGTPQVYDIEIETGVIRQLIEIPDGSEMPAISPDGSQIAFVVMTEPNWQLYVADLPEPDEEGNITPITLEQAKKLSVEDDVQSLLPWWSPDGSTVLFTVSRSPTDVEIQKVPADGSSDPVMIGEVGMSGFGWSDDGEFVLAIDNQSAGAQNLVVLNAASGELAGLVPLPFQAFLASWSPDNSEVAVVDRLTGSLWLLDADGTSLRQAVASSLVPRRVAWNPVPIDSESVLVQ